MDRPAPSGIIRGLPDAEPNDESYPIRGSPHAKVEPMGRDNTSEMTIGRDNGEDSKKGVRSSSANADAVALALISGVVGTMRSIQDMESRAPTLKMATIISIKNSAHVGTHDQYLGEANQIYCNTHEAEVTKLDAPGPRTPKAVRHG
jgi:hypothetical protein